jgi:Leucine-rich repeat (LRR) protein
MENYTLSDLIDWWRSCTILERTLLTINYMFYQKGKTLLLVEDSENQHTHESAYELAFQDKIEMYNKPMPNLEKLVCMPTLNLSRKAGINKLTSLRFLRPFATLRELNVGYNELENLEGIEYLPQLLIFNAASNKLQNIELLEGCNKLERLDISNNNIYSLRPLEKCTDLRELICNRNEIESLDALQYLPNLERLNCAYNEITDISPIDGLPLRFFDYRDNSIMPFFIPTTNAEKLMKLGNRKEILAFWWRDLPIYFRNLLTINYEFAQIGKVIPDAYPYNIFSQYLLQFKRGFDQSLCADVDLSKLLLIKNLNLNMQKVFDLEQPKSRLEQLQTLDFIAPFLPNLQVLIVNFNKIDSLSTLLFAPNLKILKCECNPLQSIDGLQKK